MNRYLFYSSGLHAAALIAALWLLSPAALKKRTDSYRIDFISPSAGVQVARPNTPAPPAPAVKTPPPPAKREEPPPKPDEIVTGKTVAKHHTTLLRPSVLSEPQPQTPAPPQEAPAGQPNAVPGTDVTADFPNFPYPWYITQLRTALWSQWTRVMPRQGTLGCVVKFEIDRMGQPTAVEVEQPSGNSLYDYAAISAVRGAAPFPPLPEEFRETTLSVHVQFRTAPN